MAGTFYSLDLGTRTGFAKGVPGAHPRSGAVLLKRKEEPPGAAFGNLIAFLQEEFDKDLPRRVFTEQSMTLEAFKAVNSSEANVSMTFGLHAIVAGVCWRYGIPHLECNFATVRKHFIGVGRMGTRKATKEATVIRARLLGLMPRDCYDEDMADAIAIHDWACATHGRQSTSTQSVYLFGERSPPAAPGGSDAGT